MNFYKLPSGDVFHTEAPPNADAVAMTQAEVETHLNPPPQLPDVPDSSTRRQGLLALLSFGHRRADIEALIAAIPDEIEREAALIEYEAATWERENPFIQSMWDQLGGTPEQLDDLFRLAVTL